MDAFTIVVITLIILILAQIYSYVADALSYWKKKGVPYASPWTINVMFIKTFCGKLHMGDPFTEVYRQLKGEPIGGFYRFFKPMLMVRDPELVKAVLMKEFQSFHDNEFQGSSDGKDPDPIMSRNPFALTGDKWKIVRSQLTPAFTSNKIRVIFPLMLEVCEELKDYLETEKFEDGIEARDLAARYTTDVVTSCAIGVKSNAVKDPNTIYRKMGAEIFKPSFWMNLKFMIALFMPKILRYLRLRIVNENVYNFFRDIIKQVKTERLKNGIVRNDFLQLLINLKEKGRVSEEDEKTTAAYTDDDIVAHVVGFFVDGFETSSIAMTYALLEIALNPKVQEKLRNEIESKIEENGGQIDYDTVIKMKYLDMVLAESMRKFPVANSLAKMCTKPCELPMRNGTVRVNTGTIINIPISGIHRDPSYFPDPEKFDPERFNEENKQQRHRFAFLPFGEGPRMCIGYRFGTAQIKAAIVTLVRHFDITVNEKTTIPIKFAKNHFMYIPEGGVWLHFKSRTS